MGSSRIRDLTGVFCAGRQFFTTGQPGEPVKTVLNELSVCVVMWIEFSEFREYLYIKNTDLDLYSCYILES